MDTQSGDLTGLFMAEEASLNVLPAEPVWREREPNSYQDFGGAYAMTRRRPITHDRQSGKGEVSDVNPTAGWNEDFTLTNMIWPMQGFLFADAREQVTTAPLNGAGVTITSVDADSYNAAAGLGIFAAGRIVLAENFGVADNNGINVVSGVAAGALTMVSPLEVEAAPPADARLTVVGHQFAAGDLTLTVTDSAVELTSTANAFATMNLPLGSCVFVGGDGAALRYADAGNNAPFYGRVAAKTNGKLTLDKTTGTQVTNNGAGKTIQLFFGTFIRNEDDCTLIKRRSYALERQYGCGVGNVQADGVTGAVPNQITITVPTPAEDAKVTVDMAFIASLAYDRTAAEGPLADTYVAALNEPCYKPGLDVYRHRLAVVDPVTLNPTPLVSYNSEVTLVVNNNVAGVKAIETFGNGDLNVGEFTVSGNINAFWTSVEATRAVRRGDDCTWDLILTKRNTAVVFDIDSLGLGNGRAQVEKNQPTRLPLENGAGRGQFGYTLAATFLRYVPAVGMAN